jgi:ABC-type Na+ transport system ATPase subunit NatA
MERTEIQDVVIPLFPKTLSILSYDTGMYDELTAYENRVVFGEIFGTNT